MFYIFCTLVKLFLVSLIIEVKTDDKVPQVRFDYVGEEDKKPLKSTEVVQLETVEQHHPGHYIDHLQPHITKAVSEALATHVPKPAADKECPCKKCTGEVAMHVMGFVKEKITSMCHKPKPKDAEDEADDENDKCSAMGNEEGQLGCEKMKKFVDGGKKIRRWLMVSLSSKFVLFLMVFFYCMGKGACKPGVHNKENLFFHDPVSHEAMTSDEDLQREAESLPYMFEPTFSKAGDVLGDIESLVRISGLEDMMDSEEWEESWDDHDHSHKLGFFGRIKEFFKRMFGHGKKEESESDDKVYLPKEEEEGAPAVEIATNRLLSEWENTEEGGEMMLHHHDHSEEGWEKHLPVPKLKKMCPHCYKKVFGFVMKKVVFMTMKMCKKTKCPFLQGWCRWAAIKKHRKIAFGMLLGMIEPWKFAIGKCYHPKGKGKGKGHHHKGKGKGKGKGDDKGKGKGKGDDDKGKGKGKGDDDKGKGKGKGDDDKGKGKGKGDDDKGKGKGKDDHGDEPVNVGFEQSIQYLPDKDGHMHKISKTTKFASDGSFKTTMTDEESLSTKSNENKVLTIVASAEEPPQPPPTLLQYKQQTDAETDTSLTMFMKKLNDMTGGVLPQGWKFAKEGNDDQ